VERFIKSVQTSLIIRVIEELVHVVGICLNVVSILIQTTVGVVINEGSIKYSTNILPIKHSSGLLQTRVFSMCLFFLEDR